MTGVSFQKGLGAVHGLSEPIGATFNTQHGLTNAVILPWVLKDLQTMARKDNEGKYLNTDPTKYVSEKTGRGPLKNEPGRKWQHTVDPVMTCYKLITIEFKWWGLQGQMEAFIMRQQKRLLINLHRQIFCSTDKWYGMTLEEIRQLEDRTREELESRRLTGEVRGTSAS